MGCGTSLSRFLARGGPDSDCLGDALVTFFGDNVFIIRPSDLVSRTGVFHPRRAFVIVSSCLSKFCVVEFHQKS